MSYVRLKEKDNLKQKKVHSIESRVDYNWFVKKEYNRNMGIGLNRH
jgi:hypothetical protein